MCLPWLRALALHYCSGAHVSHSKVPVYFWHLRREKGDALKGALVKHSQDLLKVGGGMPGWPAGLAGDRLARPCLKTQTQWQGGRREAKKVECVSVGHWSHRMRTSLLLRFSKSLCSDRRRCLRGRYARTRTLKGSHHFVPRCQYYSRP